MKKEYLYLSITESLYCTAETQLYFLKFLKKKGKAVFDSNNQDTTGPPDPPGMGPRIIHTNKYRMVYKRPPDRR